MFCWLSHGNAVVQHKKNKGKEIKPNQAQTSYYIGLG